MKLTDERLIQLANEVVSARPEELCYGNSDIMGAAEELHRYLYSDGMEIGPYQNILSTKLQKELSDNEIKQLDLLYTVAYLQCLARHDRVTDCFVRATCNGTLKKILVHYLALASSEG